MGASADSCGQERQLGTCRGGEPWKMLRAAGRIGRVLAARRASGCSLQSLSSHFLQYEYSLQSPVSTSVSFAKTLSGLALTWPGLGLDLSLSLSMGSLISLANLVLLDVNPLLTPSSSRQAQPTASYETTLRAKPHRSVQALTRSPLPSRCSQQSPAVVSRIRPSLPLSSSSARLVTVLGPPTRPSPRPTWTNPPSTPYRSRCPWNARVSSWPWQPTHCANGWMPIAVETGMLLPCHLASKTRDSDRQTNPGLSTATNCCLAPSPYSCPVQTADQSLIFAVTSHCCQYHGRARYHEH